MATQLNTGTIEQTVKSFLASHLAPATSAIASIAAQAETDEDGEERVMITINFSASEQPLEPEQFVDIPFCVAKELVASGEARFCHVRIRFAETQSLQGW